MSDQNTNAEHKDQHNTTTSNLPWHTYSVVHTASHLGTDQMQGLSEDDAAQRLKEHGPNALQGHQGINPLRLLLGHIFNSLTVVLFIAMGLSFAAQEWLEGGVVAGVIVVNAIIGFMQEYRSERTMESLRKMSTPRGIVLRDGSQKEIDTKEMVPGDVVVVNDGSIVPADMRLLEAHNLEIDESLLTGESLPVNKEGEDTVLEDEEEDLAERINMAYASCIVVRGRGKGIVVATGMDTELGSIAAKLSKGTKMKTPMQRRLTIMAWALFACCIVLAFVVFAANSFSFDSEVVLYAISISVAVIPEGLVAVVTVTMALGVRRMAKQRAIVRKLVALEALGSVTDVCSDKTGTLTQARMVATEIWRTFDAADGCGYRTCWYHVTEEGKLQRKEFEENENMREEDETKDTERGDKESDVEKDKEEHNMSPIVETCSLCNEAYLRRRQDNGENNDDDHEASWEGIGNPTEVALQWLAYRLGGGKERLEDSGRYVHVVEYPFDSSIKRMSVVYRVVDPQVGSSASEYRIYTKGAAERVLPLCIGRKGSSTTQGHEGEGELSRAGHVVEDMACRGLRALVLAMRCEVVPDEGGGGMETKARDDVERDLRLIGVVGIYDPPRKESKDSVAECHAAGITVRMVTGDHPSTAREIARQLNIVPLSAASGTRVLAARDFNAMDDDTLDSMECLPLVVARCSPDSKVKLIDALHRRGRYVVMTGDGVNDAPALKKADIGVAMGKGGSDVAKQTSDVVLTDDNFSTIVMAIREGRRIYDNIVKFIVHLMSGNIGEVIALVAGLGFIDASGRSVFPMSPLQILWLNMTTSSPPALALGVENADRHVMHRPPRSTQRWTVRMEPIVDMFYYGSWIGVLTLASWVLVLYVLGDGDLGTDCNETYSAECRDVFRARASAFATATILLLVHAYNCKDLHRPLFRMHLLDNKLLLGTVLFGVLSIMPTFYVPFINHDVFKHTGISYEWGLVVGAVLVFVVVSDVYKCVKYYGLHLGKPSRSGASASLANGEHKNNKKTNERIQV